MSSSNGNGLTLTSLRPDVFQVFLQDEDGQNVLGIDDGALRQTLQIELVNTSGRELELTSIGDEITNDKYHICVLFRPGTLLTSILDKVSLQEIEKGWKMLRQDNAFYFLLTEVTSEPRIIAPGKRLNFSLENISAAPEGGSRGTRVEIKYNNLTYKDSNETLSGNRLQYLNIVNQRGKKQIPLHVGFLGSNTILNDGITENELTLTIQTLPKMSIPFKLADGSKSNEIVVETDTDKLTEGNLSLRGTSEGTLDESTKVTITFDVATTEAEAAKDWALVDANDADNINLTIIENQQNWTFVGKEKLGITPQWSFICKKGWQTKGRQELLRLKITNLKTQLLAGYANLYVHYENVPGYWDGHINCPIHKGPLVYREINKTVGNQTLKIGSVGIGTDEPEAKLHIKYKSEDPSGYAAIFEGGNVGVGTNQPQAQLHVKPNSGHSAIFEGGKVGIGTTIPRANLHIVGAENDGANAALRITSGAQNLLLDGNEIDALADGLFLNNNTSQNVVLANGGGKVGVGISNPGVSLDVNGDIRTNVGLISDNPFGSSYVAFSHRNQGTSTGYALLQHSGGTTYLNAPSNAHIHFRINNGTRMILHNSGQVGIGTTAPASRLHVNGSLRIYGDLLLRGSPPFKVKKITGVRGGKSTGESTANWGQAVIAGFQALRGDIQEHDVGNIIQVYTYVSGSTWYVYADFRSHKTNETWNVWVLFIRKELV